MIPVSRSCWRNTRPTSVPPTTDRLLCEPTTLSPAPRCASLATLSAALYYRPVAMMMCSRPCIGATHSGPVPDTSRRRYSHLCHFGLSIWWFSLLGCVYLISRWTLGTCFARGEWWFHFSAILTEFFKRLEALYIYLPLKFFIDLDNLQKLLLITNCARW